MHYLCIRNIYFSTTYHLSVYEIIYETLGHIHPGIFTAADKGKYNPPHKKGWILKGIYH